MSDLCHPLEEGDPEGLDSRLRGNDILQIFISYQKPMDDDIDSFVLNKT